MASIEGGESFSGRELERRIRGSADALSRYDVGPGRRVLLVRAQRPRLLVELLAVWRLGACAVCADPGLTAREVENIVRFIGPTLILADQRFAAPPEVTIPVLSDLDGDGPPQRPTSRPAAPIGPALMLLTSGTTGTPKIVVLSYSALAARLAFNLEHIEASTLNCTLCPLPLHFGHGLIGNCLTALLAGKRVLLAPAGQLATAVRLGELIDEHGVTFMSSVPSFWRLVLAASRPPRKDTLRQVSIGSEPLPASLWRAVVAWSGISNVVNMYGITEAANWICGASAADFEPRDGLVGRPWGGELRVRTDAGELQRVGAGELVVRSPCLMDGYFEQPLLTADVIRDGWLRTGDLGTIDGTGAVVVHGRLKEQINRSGVKVHPAEIDALLARHPDVEQACAFGVEDARKGEIVAVAFKPAAGAALDATALERWCRERLRSAAVPERWYAVSEIPLTDRGKVSRTRVREHCLRSGHPDTGVAPQ